MALTNLYERKKLPLKIKLQLVIEGQEMDAKIRQEEKSSTDLERLAPLPGQTHYIERSQGSNLYYCVRRAKSQVKSKQDLMIKGMERLSLDVAMRNCSRLNEGKIKI